MAYVGSVVLTQTHPAAPYVCRTGNITLRCQYDDVENVLSLQWNSGGMLVGSISDLPGHTAITSSSTYEDVAVDNYNNLRMSYRCAAISAVYSNGTVINMDSPLYVPVIEGEFSNIQIIIVSSTQPIYCLCWLCCTPFPIAQI